MWSAFGKRTIECMARGSRFLAKIWLGAWTAGSGNQKIGEGTLRKQNDIMKLYNNPDFVPSVRLDKYPCLLTGAATHPGSPRRHLPTRGRASGSAGNDAENRPSR